MRSQRTKRDAVAVIENSYQKYKQKTAVALIEKTYQQYRQRMKGHAFGPAHEEAAVKIQSRFRGYTEKVKYLRSRRAIVTVQRFFRGKREQDAARKIQRFIREVHAKNHAAGKL